MMLSRGRPAVGLSWVIQNNFKSNQSKHVLASQNRGFYYVFYCSLMYSMRELYKHLKDQIFPLHCQKIFQTVPVMWDFLQLAKAIPFDASYWYMHSVYCTPCLCLHEKWTKITAHNSGLISQLFFLIFGCKLCDKKLLFRYLENELTWWYRNNILTCIYIDMSLK